MKRSMVIFLALVFFLMAVQSSAVVRITPDGIPPSDDTSSIHLNGIFSSHAESPEGAVVSGSNTYGDEYYSLGGYFSAAGVYGRGVYGVASGSSGRGVYGYASNDGNVINSGGFFRAEGSDGRGVHGVASGSSGRGVYGVAFNNGNVTNYGGYFEAWGSDGEGVHGLASGNSGKGVYGVASNDGNVTNWGGYFMAKGLSGRGIYATSSGSSGRGVYGYASNNGDVTNYGGYFNAAGANGRGVYGYGRQYNFYADGPGTDYGPFTGAHEVKFGTDIPEEILPGLIVSATGKAELRKNADGKISLSSTLPTVALSAIERDKAVFGVIVSQGSLHEDHWYESKAGERFGVVNALGEGRVWVTNQKGAIVAGDYITTSAIPGYGQRQEDDLLHSYTLGKAIQTIDWDRVSETIEYKGETYKVYLVAVVYTSG